MGPTEGAATARRHRRIERDIASIIEPKVRRDLELQREQRAALEHDICQEVDGWIAGRWRYPWQSPEEYQCERERRLVQLIAQLDVVRHNPAAWHTEDELRYRARRSELERRFDARRPLSPVQLYEVLDVRRQVARGRRKIAVDYPDDPAVHSDFWAWHAAVAEPRHARARLAWNHCARHLATVPPRRSIAQRRGGSGRPRAQASRSSARSGDGGGNDDGSGSEPPGVGPGRRRRISSSPVGGPLHAR